MSAILSFFNVATVVVLGVFLVFSGLIPWLVETFTAQQIIIGFLSIMFVANIVAGLIKASR